MGSRRKKNVDDLGDSIFANNPFLDDLIEWGHSPEGQKFAEQADVLCDLLEDVHPSMPSNADLSGPMESGSISISPLRTSKSNDFSRDGIEEYLIDWIDIDYAPEHYSEAQLDELDKLTARWIADHSRRTKTSKTQRKTRRS